ncbi:MAG: hypothetical protein KAS07_00240 [Candidatus Pacebacteria bacterium]|nr:hypothetical protein [Candidatus Paceibacterota bacterium]
MKKTCKFKKGNLHCLSVVFSILLVIPQVSFAYLDPGSGSYIIQVLIASMVGILYGIRLYIPRFFHFIRSKLLWFLPTRQQKQEKINISTSDYASEKKR